MICMNTFAKPRPFVDEVTGIPYTYERVGNLGEDWYHKYVISTERRFDEEWQITVGNIVRCYASSGWYINMFIDSDGDLVIIAGVLCED